MVFPWAGHADGGRDIQQHPHQRCVAFEGTVGRAHAPSAKGNAYYETAHSEKRRIARSWKDGEKGVF